MKPLKDSIFRILVLVAGIIIAAAAYRPFSGQKPMTVFTGNKQFSLPVNYSHAGDSLTIFPGIKAKPGLKNEQPPLNILASYVLMRANAGKTAKSKSPEMEAAIRKHLLIRFIKPVF